MFHVADIVGDYELKRYRFISTDEAHAVQSLALYLGSQVQQMQIERFPELHEVFP